MPRYWWPPHGQAHFQTARPWHALSEVDEFQRPATSSTPPVFTNEYAAASSARSAQPLVEGDSPHIGVVSARQPRGRSCRRRGTWNASTMALPRQVQV